MAFQFLMFAVFSSLQVGSGVGLVWVLLRKVVTCAKFPSVTLTTQSVLSVHLGAEVAKETDWEGRGWRTKGEGVPLLGNS